MNTMSPRFAQTVIEWRSTAPLLFYLPKECKLTACGESGQLVEHFDFVKKGFIEATCQYISDFAFRGRTSLRSASFSENDKLISHITRKS